MTATTTKTTMQAITRTAYGPPEVLELREVEKPMVGETELLVRVHAAAVNPVDWHELTGVPYLVRLREGIRRPKSQRLGADFAGTVEAVGPSVTRFQPGDEVFGGKHGSLAEYLVVPEDRAVVSKPAGVTFEQAAAVPIAGITALQALRDKGQLRPGQKVLVNGASGGVGTFAVQIAKALGARVTGVCSTRNVDPVRSLGADRVIDYTQEDFTRSGERYDLMLDIAGSRSESDRRRVLAREARVVLVGGKKTKWLIGALVKIMLLALASKFRSQKVVPFLAKLNREDMETLREMLEAGTLVPVIDRSYPLSEAPAALAYLGEGHARGKVVVSV